MTPYYSIFNTNTTYIGTLNPLISDDIHAHIKTATL